MSSAFIPSQALKPGLQGVIGGCREERHTSSHARVRFRGIHYSPRCYDKIPNESDEGKIYFGTRFRVQSIVAGIKSWCTGSGWTYCFHRKDRQRINSCAHLTFSVLLSLGPLLTGMSPSIFNLDLPTLFNLIKIILDDSNLVRLHPSINRHIGL